MISAYHNVPEKALKSPTNIVISGHVQLTTFYTRETFSTEVSETSNVRNFSLYFFFVLCDNVTKSQRMAHHLGRADSLAGAGFFSWPSAVRMQPLASAMACKCHLCLCSVDIIAGRTGLFSNIDSISPKTGGVSLGTTCKQPTISLVPLKPHKSLSIRYWRNFQILNN